MLYVGHDDRLASASSLCGFCSGLVSSKGEEADETLLVRKYIYVCIYSVHLYTSTCIYTYDMNICMYVCMFLCMSACMHVHCCIASTSVTIKSVYINCN